MSSNKTRKKKFQKITEKDNEKELYTKAFAAKLNSWNCFNKNKNKQNLCRNLLIQLIKIHVFIPKCKQLYPDASSTQINELWTSSLSKSSPKSPSSGSPENLVMSCPRCKSTDIVSQGWADSTLICRTCAHTWQLIGGGWYGADRGRSAYNNWKIPITVGYVDKKGNVVDPKFPKIYPDSEPNDAKEKYFMKSMNEILDFFKAFKKEWDLKIYNSIITYSASIFSKYLQSLESAKGMPKTQKRKALMATIVYYGSVLSKTGLKWDKIAKIFEVNTSDMEKIKDKEIDAFWKTKQGAPIAAELFPLLLTTDLVSSPSSSPEILESPEVDTEEPDSELPIEESKASISSKALQKQIYDKLKKQPNITKIGIAGFIMNLKGENIKPLSQQTNKNITEIKKYISFVENWYDNRPSDLSNDILQYL
tara:strand:- start:8416 stop:9678 length:1263 start_codon:yes stop_codon:yes gene_type:complete